MCRGGDDAVNKPAIFADSASNSLHDRDPDSLPQS
jgi:hypothetical protein